VCEPGHHGRILIVGMTEHLHGHRSLENAVAGPIQLTHPPAPSIAPSASRPANTRPCSIIVATWLTVDVVWTP
jgi:hypothetical protein